MVYLLIGIGLGAVLAVIFLQHDGGADAGKDITNRNTEDTDHDPGRPATTKSAVSSIPDPVEIKSGSTVSDMQSSETAFQELMDRIWSGKASPDEQLEFWQKLRESDEIDNIIKSKEQETLLDSDDIDAQMNLANLYVAKIYSSPAGPEMGLWAGKAEERWRAVLAIDPNHWEAQYSVAFSLSQYPEFLNMTGAAITEYEKAVTLQESREPEPQFAKTYLELYRLYEKRGDRGNAVDALRQGLDQFPEDPTLLEQWNSISTLVIPELE